MNEIPDGFIKWEGSNDLQPSGMVEIIIRYGATGKGGALSFSWRHNNLGTDIIAHRPITTQLKVKIK